MYFPPYLMVSTGFAFEKNEIQQIVEMCSKITEFQDIYPNSVRVTNTRAYTERKTEGGHIKLLRSYK